MNSEAPAPRLVLASESPARREMLRRAGLAFETMPANVDEAAIKSWLKGERMPPRDVVGELARAKADRVSKSVPEALVIGADQILVMDGQIFDKPSSRHRARATLRKLSGRVHRLMSAVAVARDGRVVWRHLDQAELEMRDLSNAFIDRYLEEIGEVATQTVGAYAIEGRGVQLFSRVEGDHFTILGLPLLPLLAYLRERGVLTT